MAIAIDYKFTFQDSLDASETSNECKFDLPWIKWGLIRGGSFTLIALGLYCVVEGFTNPLEPDPNLAKVGGLCFVVWGILWVRFMQPKISQSRLNRWATKKEWESKKYQEEIRNISVTETEFIFKTKHSEMAWTWKAFNNFFEGEKGFILWFHSEHQKYVPKRIFDSLAEVEKFRSILEKHHE